MRVMTSHPRPQNIQLGPIEVRLPDEPDTDARAALDEDLPPDDAARRYPAASIVWAVLAENALEAGAPVAAYAYARTGYHRGLDALRRAGWKGQGLIPLDHQPNQGFLRALLALGQAADQIGEDDEARRCTEFLANSGASPEAVAALR